MDLFQNLTWAGKDWKDTRPDKLPSLEDTTIVVWNNSLIKFIHVMKHLVK